MGGSWKENLKAWSREVREGSLEEGGQAESPGLTRRSQAEQAWQRLACLQLREETDKAGPDPTCQQGPRSVATARPGVDKVLGDAVWGRCHVTRKPGVKIARGC